MNELRFDTMARKLADGSLARRSIMRGLGGAAVAGLALAGTPGLQARKRRGKKRKNKAPLNRFGCRNVGVACASASQCCSGLCETGPRKKGKKPKKTCRAHDTGGCQVAQDSCSTNTDFGCVTTTGEDGFCHLTTGNAPFCAFDGIDSECTRDEDCVALCGKGAACSLCAVPGDVEFRFCAGLSRCPGPLPD